MLDWSALRGSRLAHSCRRCGRRFCCFTTRNSETSAIDEDGRMLETAVSDRWLSEACPRLFNASDDEDRKRLYRRGLE